VTITHAAVAGPLVELSDYQAAHVIVGSLPGSVPVGGIIMWSGSIASIPASWAFCDGSSNAPGPDLRNTFIVGAQQDVAGVPNTNIEGSLKVSATQTGASVANHTNLTHAGAAIGDHTNLTHDGSIGNHPDLTHAALSHAALTVVHADHSLASVTHTHASGADVSVPSGSFAAATGSHASGSVAAATASRPSLAVASASIASGADVSVPSSTGASAAGVSSFATSTNRSGLTALPTHSHAAATASRPSLTIASQAIASGVDVSVPSGSFASGADVSLPSGSHAAVTASRPSATGSEPALTVTHADHSLASLSHQSIGTHLSTVFGTHAFTPPAGHGSAGTVTHSFTEPNDHAISAHSTVAIVPAYYALAYIQRMS
jgi:hypothetical protein